MTSSIPPTKKNTLNQLRQEIADIDEQIISLVLSRLDCAVEIGKIKKEMQMEITNSAVEETVRTRYRSRLPSDFAESLATLLISESKQVQK